LLVSKRNEWSSEKNSPISEETERETSLLEQLKNSLHLRFFIYQSSCLAPAFSLKKSPLGIAGIIIGKDFALSTPNITGGLDAAAD
jgi:hypothetical protein